MEEFLGILFAGGRGTRLGLITQYISKAFVPVYDRPVFMYPLAQLEASRYITEIIILTNEENDARLRQLGYRTIVQDDALVHDMFSGLQFIKSRLKTDKHFVLMPCDNISDLVIDQTIQLFLERDVEVCFNVVRIPDRQKLSQMGVFDPETQHIRYKPLPPTSEWGVVAPYVVRNDVVLPAGTTDEAINQTRFTWMEHKGYWFDVGDARSLVECTVYVAERAARGKDITPVAGRWHSDRR